jgi:hypothetical protein
MLTAQISQASPGEVWTHIVRVTIPHAIHQAVDILLFYDAKTGIVNTGQLDNSGTYQYLQGGPAGTFAVGWTDIVKVSMPQRDPPLRFEALLFYNANTGIVNTLGLDDSGNWQTLQGFPAYKGWTKIVRLGTGALLFYDAKSGQAETGWFDDSGNYQTIRGFAAGSFAVGMTHIQSERIGGGDADVPPVDFLLFYNTATGQVYTYRLDSSGYFTFLHNFLAHVGWTKIVSDVIWGE